MLDTIFFIFIGLIFGLIAGILPGIHPNQIYVALMSLLPLLSDIEPNAILALILSTAMANTLSNYLPAIFFSVPDPNTVINVLPGHRMVLDGKGMDALFISLVGAFLTLVVCLVSLPLLLYLIPIVHEFLYPYLQFLLIGLSFYMIWMEKAWKDRIFCLSIYLLSGLWGILTLNSTIISADWALFPTLTGMFGIAGLLLSMEEVTKLPSQDISEDVNIGNVGKIVGSGVIAGLLIGVLPGAGESQAGVLVSQFTGLSQNEFLGTLAGINMSNLFFALVSLYSFGKIRSGSAAAIDEVILEFGLEHLVFSVGIVLFSGALSVLATWYLGKKTLKTLERVNYRLLSQIIIGFTAAMVFWLTGIVGVFILIISTCLGLLAVLLEVKRTSNMGYLMIPTIIYFSGLTHVINSFLF